MTIPLPVSALPYTDSDSPDDNVPQGEETSEQFVLKVSEYYFERLDVCVCKKKKESFLNELTFFSSCLVALPS